MELYSLKDIKAGTFGNCMSFINRGVALRSLAEAAAQPDTMLFKHGEDYQLYHVANFDPASGAVESLSTPDFIITVSDLRSPQRAAA